ncbi:ran guanine nucleotide release factor [Esox lucius]|uniref:Ran guanine nucleotide release factor n=1 Tax=Esox lucius TaxID=8010 RepID=A0AAY5KCB9_ESOLU|nr:ran guanine nucleotide release factor [Esox lucius]
MRLFSSVNKNGYFVDNRVVFVYILEQLRMQDVRLGRPLFGGALSATIPYSAKDISELREIPDNQEVFAHCHTDQSIIVELLEFQNHVQNEDAARYHFEDVAGSNKALAPGTSEVRTVVALPKSQLSLEECSSAWLLTGTQLVAKFNEEAKNTVTFYLGLFRLPQFSTDILVTFNDPLSISLDSSSAVAVGADQQVGTEPWTLNNFQCLLQSLRLHDPGVFG